MDKDIWFLSTFWLNVLSKTSVKKYISSYEFSEIHTELQGYSFCLICH